LAKFRYRHGVTEYITLWGAPLNGDERTVGRDKGNGAPPPDEAVSFFRKSQMSEKHQAVIACYVLDVFAQMEAVSRNLRRGWRFPLMAVFMAGSHPFSLPYSCHFCTLLPTTRKPVGFYPHRVA
jgi:hypothetical protein